MEGAGGAKTVPGAKVRPEAVTKSRAERYLRIAAPELPPISGKGGQRRARNGPEVIKMRQRTQAMDRLNEVGELEARRKRVLGPVFLP
mmetsp:Transcript_22841/g.61251  ORF Transcript_22841/g.61251 Transcript_22841/m.61251 type:complete len:88 (+) Transcript_22841:1062-1325(+)